MNKVYTTRELTESALIFNRKPPAFGVIITILISVFILSALIWAALSIKTYVVKAAGLCASDNKVNVMNRVSGAIKTMNVKEGDSVKAGDVLFEFDSFQVTLQITKMQADLKFYSNKRDVLERLIFFINNFTIKNVESRENPFDKEKSSELSAYANAQSFIDYIRNQEVEALNNHTEYSQNEVDSIKTSFLNQQLPNLEELVNLVLQKTSEIKMYEDSLAEYIVRAEASGVVHLGQGITVGTVISAGTMLGSISDVNPSTLYFQSILNASDRSKIKLGDAVEIAVAGLSQSEFGIIKGKVIEIDMDSNRTEGGEMYYTVKIRPDKTTVINSRGDEVNLTTGMLAESRIKYNETTWLRWAIEQIGVKFK